MEIGKSLVVLRFVVAMSYEYDGVGPVYGFVMRFQQDFYKSREWEGSNTTYLKLIGWLVLWLAWLSR